jgi:hypothetical protein
MTEPSGAHARVACPACGGEANWHPGKQKLVCPFCGTESAAQPPAVGEVVEHDLAAALAKLLDQPRGWQADKRQVRCASCRAISVLDAARQGGNCEFCGSAQLVPYGKATTRSARRACCRCACRRPRRATASDAGMPASGSPRTR